MMRVFYVIAVWFCTMVTAAHGDVNVEFRSTGGSFSSVSGFPVPSTVSAITLTISQAGTFRVYTDNPSTEPIPRIGFTGNTSVDINLIIVQPSVNDIAGITTEFPPGTEACNDWFGFEGGSFRIYVQALINGDLRNYVNARQVVRLDIGGTVFPTGTAASNSLIQSNSSLKFGAVVANGDINGLIRAQVGDIGRIESLNGNINADIQAVAGNIDLVQALGSATNTGIIKANICAAKKLKQVLARRIERAASTFASCPDGCCTAQFVATGTGSAPGSGTDYDYSAIDEIAAAETIGTSGALVTIKSNAGPDQRSDTNEENYNNGSISLIRGGTIFADIETSIPGGPAPYSASNRRGNITRIVTNDGSAIGALTVSGSGAMVGSVRTFTFGANPSDQTPSLELNGLLQGHILLDGTFKQPVRVNGGIHADGLISLREQDLAADNVGIEVTGEMAGRIEVEGNKDAPIKVTGDVSGTIDIGKSVRGAPATNRDYGGRLIIDNGSLTSTGIINVGGTVVNTPDRIEIEIDGNMAGQINIGKSLAGQIVMTAGGLQGQIIINQDNQVAPNHGVWTGTVQVGTIELKPGAGDPLNVAPYYSRSASTLGGGAVGLAPFHLYQGDCTPPHNDLNPMPQVLSSDFINTNNTPIKIVQYGPIAQMSGSGADVTIEMQNPSNHCMWTDMTMMFGTVVYAPNGSNLRTIGLRGVIGSPPFSGVYRVFNNRVGSARVTGVPDVVYPNTIFGGGSCSAGVYVFRIHPDCNRNGIEDVFEVTQNPPISADNNNNNIPDGCEVIYTVCPCDWNHSDIVSVQDLFDFLASYFAGSGDFNQSGTTTVQDIFDFLSCFFGLPTPCTSM